MNHIKNRIRSGVVHVWCVTLLWAGLSTVNVHAQQPSGNGDGKTPRIIFTVVEQPPQFPGGADSLRVYLEKNLREPLEGREKSKAQTVTTTFIINETGAIDRVRILKSTDKSLNAEALRVTESMPAWIPARQNGRTVAFHYELPIHFPPKGK